MIGKGRETSSRWRDSSMYKSFLIHPALCQSGAGGLTVVLTINTQKKNVGGGPFIRRNTLSTCQEFNQQTLDLDLQRVESLSIVRPIDERGLDPDGFNGTVIPNTLSLTPSLVSIWSIVPLDVSLQPTSGLDIWPHDPVW